ncbi:peptidase domain-containing ABC transporter [Leptolyngbyaceae cyanobacterium UHCC 1019]
MTGIDSRQSQLDSFIPNFFSVYPFCRLPADVRGQVASRLTLCTFRLGEVIHREGELPPAVHCVVQGQIRLLGSAAAKSPTLSVKGEGAVVGWDSLLRRVANGSVRAAGTDEVLTLALPADDFERLAVTYLEEALTEQVTQIELYDTLSRFLSLFPTKLDINIKEVARYTEQEQMALVIHWSPQSVHLETQTLRLPSERVWLVSGKTKRVEIGTPITVRVDLHPPNGSPFPLRLIGIDRNFLAAVVLKGSLPTLMEVEEDGVTIPVEPELMLESQSAIALVEAQEALEQNLNRGETKELKQLLKNYPVHYSREFDPVEDLVACFWMLADRLKVPFRPDLLRQWLQRRENVTGDSLLFCAWVAEAVGLKTQIIKFVPTAAGLKRLQFPALIMQDGVLTLLYELTRNNGVVVGSPRTGIVILPPEDAADQIAIDSIESGTPVSQALIVEQHAQTPLKQFGVSWFLPILNQHRGVLMQVLIASVFVQLLGLANPLLVQQIIDKVIINSSGAALPMFGILMVAFSSLEAILTILRSYLLSSTTNRVDLVLGTVVVRHLLNLPLNFFEKRPVGELSARLSELENIRQFLTSTALTAVLDVVFSLLYVGVMLLYSVQLTICVLAFVPIVIVLTLLVASILNKQIRIKADQNSRVQSYLIEVLGGIFTIKSQNMEGLAQATWRDQYLQYLGTSFKTGMINTSFGSLSNLINTLSSLLVLWIGAELVLKGELTLGGLIAFRIIAGYVVGPMVRLSRLWQRFQETALSLELLTDIVEAPTEVLPEDESNVALPPVEGWVQYEAISFGFKPGQLQLSNVSLDISIGSFVGVVGQSGSGKSTLVKLLPRLYLPNAGSIYVDGYDISKVDLFSLREQIGIVPQDSILFEGTIRDNITRFDTFADEDVIEAARVADAHDFIMQLSNGYSTQVGERGAKLSGGQRQRIAIARMVLRNPRLLILDEATSALDYNTEQQVCLNLAKKFKGRTVFFITHRLNTIRHADLIVLMEQGCVVEQGTHAELMALQGRYFCLSEQQKTEAV